MMRFLLNPVGLILLAALFSETRAQEIIRNPEPDAPLTDRWAWALAESGNVCSRGCWIGYGIQRMMEANSYSGWNAGHGNRRPTLQALVYGREVEPLPSTHDGRQVASGSKMMMKELALLFRFEQADQSLREIHVSNISLPVKLDGLPLLWLGRAEQLQSIQLLKDEFARTSTTELKEELIGAVGMHEADELVVPFLAQVLAGKDDEDVRSQAVFWLAETRHRDVLTLLDLTARSDVSEDVREQAVFGISRIETDAADDLLIGLARALDNRETREQAIFWLGQKASKRAAENLEEIAENDPDFEIQKKAVFAISQLKTDEGIPRLINIAKTHRNPKVRHEAIFWLGESGDPRAVDVLVQIVRGQ